MLGNPYWLYMMRFFFSGDQFTSEIVRSGEMDLESVFIESRRLWAASELSLVLRQRRVIPRWLRGLSFDSV